MQVELWVRKWSAAYHCQVCFRILIFNCFSNTHTLLKFKETLNLGGVPTTFILLSQHISKLYSKYLFLYSWISIALMPQQKNFLLLQMESITKKDNLLKCREQVTVCCLSPIDSFTMVLLHPKLMVNHFCCYPGIWRTH